MGIHLQSAGPGDVADLVTFRAEVNRDLEMRFGKGLWIAGLSEKGVLFGLRHSSVFIARYRGKLIGTLTLGTKKPWAIDRTYFAASKRPLYLTSMAVHPGVQGRGIGRQCVAEARRIALVWPADAVRLDAFDLPAGAGDFYRKCGFTEVGRATYRTAPLIYYEMLL